MPPPPAKKQKRTALPSARKTCAFVAAAASASASVSASTSASASAAAAASATPAASSTTPATETAAPSADQQDNEEEDYHPAQSLPPSSKPSGAFKALALLPPVRAAEACTSKTLDLLRTSNREAYLAQCVGAVSAALCKSCRKGLGPWTQCCVVADFLCSSCANCHYGGEGRRCSLRSGKLSHFPSPFPFSDIFRISIFENIEIYLK